MIRSKILNIGFKYLTALFFFHLNYATAQPTTTFHTIKLNKNIILNQLDSLSIKSLSLWDDYLSNKSNDDYTNLLWSKEEQLLFGKHCSIRLKYIDYSQSKNLFNYYKPLILSINKLGRKYLIKSAFYTIDRETNLPHITDIIDNYAVIEDEKLLLQSALFNNIKKLHCRKTKTLQLYYSDTNNIVVNNKLDSINHKIATIYKTPTIEAKYFITKSINEYRHLLGYDYERTMFISTSDGKLQEGALSEMANNLIFNGSEDPLENFTHELSHLYTYKAFGNSTEYLPYHNFFNEGFATYLGGTTGKSLTYLLKVLKKGIDKGEYKTDFSNLLDNSYGISKEDANLVYVTGGLICKIVYEKYGMNGICQLFKSGNSDESLYAVVEKTLGVKRENLNQFIDNELKKYAE